MYFSKGLAVWVFLSEDVFSTGAILTTLGSAGGLHLQ